MPPRDWSKYTPEQRAESVEYQKQWRQTDAGKRRRNISHWTGYGVREPLEGWNAFWETFKLKTHCELCNVKFNLENHNTKQGRCLDHHHHSGYFRNVICRGCNLGHMKKFDSKHDLVLFQLQRSFRLSSL
mgnify:CR=1 FL=1|tara:strand:- start:433 stop:822 length:390 start_codon:yes stop_codon:yes gene_type:complete